MTQIHKSVPDQSTTVQLQTAFFNHIQKRLGDNTKMAVEIMGLLGISKGEAYKKISGKSILTLWQVQQLCSYFKTSFTVHGHENRASSSIHFTPFHTNAIGVKEYIGSLEKFLRNIASAKAATLTCATDDIPIFHMFAYPELTAFKLHTWQLRIVDHAPFKFSMNDWGTDVLKSAATMHELYLNIPSIEIWTKTSLLNTLDQISFAATNKMITDKKTGRLICEQLRSALADIETYAVNRSKLNKQGSSVLFDWFFYDVIGSITYLAEMDDELAAYIRFNTFNTIQEENGPLCKEVKHWLHNLIKDATGFSGQGSIQRNQYLANAYAKCDEMAAMF